MYRIVRQSAVVTIAATLGACTNAAVLRVDSTPRPASTAAVPVLLDEPVIPYRSIALVVVGGGASLDQMARRLTKEAAKLGGDAVLITRGGSESTTAVVRVGKTWVPISSDDTKLFAKVIVYDH
jgi:hypothetical protein